MTDPEAFSATYRRVVDEITPLLPTDLSALARHNPGWSSNRFDPRKYLLESEVRYQKAFDALHSAGARRILDVGGFLGTFPLTLRRLGSEVTIAEKYGYYDHALDRIAQHLTANGVSVIDADFTEALDDAAAVSSRFDGVTCMAVAEHLAHTPRHMMENIRASLVAGGAFVFEVPNLAFWPRRFSLLFKGKTVHPPMADLYHSAVPFTGHHREYTLEDARYVMQQAGFNIVSEQTFNYSIDTRNPWQRVKYAPAFLFKEWAEVILLHCSKSA